MSKMPKIRIPNSKHQTMAPPRGWGLRRTNLGHCYLPFDLAQGGELVEPFVFLGFVICNFRTSIRNPQSEIRNPASVIPQSIPN